MPIFHVHVRIAYSEQSIVYISRCNITAKAVLVHNSTPNTRLYFDSASNFSGGWSIPSLLGEQRGRDVALKNAHYANVYEFIGTLQNWNTTVPKACHCLSDPYTCSSKVASKLLHSLLASP